MKKSEIRKILKKQRLNLGSAEVEAKSKLIADNFIINFIPKIPNFASKKLAFYVAADNEINPEPIMKYAAKIGNIIALPRIAKDNLHLSFKKYQFGNSLEKNILYPNLLEPKSDNADIDPDIVFVPLVAFDYNCNRIGMGKGFYDFTINNLRTNSNNTTIFIGLAYDFQLYNKIPTDKYDQMLDFVVSGSRIFTCKSSK